MCLMQNQIQNHHNLWNQLTSCWENWDFLILHWKVYSKFFLRNSMSGRIAQWSTHWPSDLKVPGSTPPWSKLFFYFFFTFFIFFFVKLYYFYIKFLKKVICEIPFVLKLNRMLNIFTSCLNININVLSKDVSQIQRYFGFNWLICGRI